MNISSISSAVPTITSTSGVQASPVAKDSDGDGDGSGGRRVHSSHSGGHMHQALMQALQSLGLNMPQSSGATGSASAAGTASTTGASPAASQVKDDMHKFMHALFQAVKSETSAQASTDASSGDSKSSFAAGLSALISQVGSGSAPAGLQDAFSKLAADLQGSQSPPATTSASVPAANASTPPTLQALLTNLQQDLGYGKSSTSAIGNVVSAQA